MANAPAAAALSVDQQAAYGVHHLGGGGGGDGSSAVYAASPQWAQLPYGFAYGPPTMPFAYPQFPQYAAGAPGSVTYPSYPQHQQQPGFAFAGMHVPGVGGGGGGGYGYPDAATASSFHLASQQHPYPYPYMHAFPHQQQQQQQQQHLYDHHYQHQQPPADEEVDEKGEGGGEEDEDEIQAKAADAKAAAHALQALQTEVERLRAEAVAVAEKRIVSEQQAQSRHEAEAQLAAQELQKAQAACATQAERCLFAEEAERVAKAEHLTLTTTIETLRASVITAEAAATEAQRVTAAAFAVELADCTATNEYARENGLHAQADYIQELEQRAKEIKEELVAVRGKCERSEDRAKAACLEASELRASRTRADALIARLKKQHADHQMAEAAQIRECSKLTFALQNAQDERDAAEQRATEIAAAASLAEQVAAAAAQAAVQDQEQERAIQQERATPLHVPCGECKVLRKELTKFRRKANSAKAAAEANGVSGGGVSSTDGEDDDGSRVKPAGLSPAFLDVLRSPASSSSSSKAQEPPNDVAAGHLSWKQRVEILRRGLFVLLVHMFDANSAAQEQRDLTIRRNLELEGLVGNTIRIFTRELGNRAKASHLEETSTAAAVATETETEAATVTATDTIGAKASHHGDEDVVPSVNVTHDAHGTSYTITTTKPPNTSPSMVDEARALLETSHVDSVALMSTVQRYSGLSGLLCELHQAAEARLTESQAQMRLDSDQVHRQRDAMFVAIKVIWEASLRCSPSLDKVARASIEQTLRHVASSHGDRTAREFLNSSTLPDAKSILHELVGSSSAQPSSLAEQTQLARKINTSMADLAQSAQMRNLIRQISTLTTG